MLEKSISRVVAENLSRRIAEAGITQAALAKDAGVSQKTISNYANPDQRAETGSGKPPSPKLEELDKIARALEVPLWHLVREMTDKERKFYEHIERAYLVLVSEESEPVPLTTTAQQSGKKEVPGRYPGQLIGADPGKGKTGDVDRPGQVQKKRSRGRA